MMGTHISTDLFSGAQANVSYKGKRMHAWKIHSKNGWLMFSETKTKIKLHVASQEAISQPP